jgi:hypothetical protein
MMVSIPTGDRSMSRRALCALVGLTLLVAKTSFAESPLVVSACDLMNDPTKYSEQVVRVRAGVSMGYEDFTLVASDCPQGTRPIWLAYGGDEPTPITSTVNDQDRVPGSVLKVNGRPVTLERNAALELFKKRLAAQRIGRSDDLGCRDCPLYEVTATLTGVFFAVPPHRDGGYGHLGCCHLLAIQQIADVDAQRTAVPAGGRFTCSKELWNMSATEAQSLEAKRKTCHSYDCGAAATGEIAAIVDHWNDSTGAVSGTYSGFGDWADWRANDLLRDYSVQIRREKNRTNSAVITGGVATRTMCKAVSPPYPSSAPIACRNLWARFPVSESTARGIQEQVKLGHDSWRLGSPENAAKLALQDAARQWQLELSHDLKQDKCMNAVVAEGDQFTWCAWIDQNSMQVVSIELMRFGFLRHRNSWTTVPWILTGGSGTACTVDQ